MKLEWWWHISYSTWEVEWRQKDQEFKTTLGYLGQSQKNKKPRVVVVGVGGVGPEISQIVGA